MNGEDFKEVRTIAEGLGYEVEPTPEAGEDMPFFDITSDGAAINPQRLRTALHQSERFRPGGDIVMYLGGPHRFSFQDTSVVSA
jgi:hypothetical protein